MNIFSQLFGNAGTGGTTNSTPAAQTVQQQGQQSEATAQGQAMQQGATQSVATANAPASPLDAYAVLWQNQPTQAQADPLSAEVVPMGAEQLQALQQRVNSVNFLSGVKPEAVTAALSGDATAFASVINSAVQQAMMQAVRVNGAMLNAGLNQRTQDIMKALPSNVHQALTSSQLRQELPIFNNPAAAPLLSALEQNLALNQPGITPAQAAQIAKSYLQEFAAEISGNKTGAAGSSTSTPAGIDWSKMFGTA